MTIEIVTNILDNVNFNFFDKPYRWTVQQKGDGFLIKISMKLKCNESSEECWQHGGKHYISSHAIPDEVVKKAWKACKDFVMHEAHEAFTYKDQTVFNPHIPMDALAEFSSSTELVRRDVLEIQANAQDVDH